MRADPSEENAWREDGLNPALSVNICVLNVKKIDMVIAEIAWIAGYVSPGNFYEIHYTTNRSNFTSVSIVEKQAAGSAYIPYKYLFTKSDFNETYYFPLVQIFTNGKSLLTNIKSIDFKQLKLPEYSLDTNPSYGIIGIKFDKIITGKLLVIISNVQGQTAYNKKIEISDINNRQATSLQRGIYRAKVKEVMGQRSYVNQHFIK